MRLFYVKTTTTNTVLKTKRKTESKRITDFRLKQSSKHFGITLSMQTRTN